MVRASVVHATIRVGGAAWWLGERSRRGPRQSDGAARWASATTRTNVPFLDGSEGVAT